MSDTITDLPKVTQMLDAGWRVTISKNDLGSYTATAEHDKDFIVNRVRRKIVEQTPAAMRELVASDIYDMPSGMILTDDFTPEQALTRLAYKVHGEIL